MVGVEVGGRQSGAGVPGVKHHFQVIVGEFRSVLVGIQRHQCLDLKGCPYFIPFVFSRVFYLFAHFVLLMFFSREPKINPCGPIFQKHRVFLNSVMRYYIVEVLCLKRV